MEAALAVAVKGISLLSMLLEAGKDVGPVINDLSKVFNSEHKPTDEELNDLEGRLDEGLDEFNSDLPEDDGTE